MDNIKQIELEITTDCNASCPQCSRNFYGGPKWPTVPRVSLNLVWLQQKIPLQKLSSLELLRFCGTYGDPGMHPDLIDIVKWVKLSSNAKIVVSTNGGMQNQSWWKDLATVLNDDDRIIFGIDGLADTNHLYRKNVDFTKVIENAQTFNNAGGKSVWQFILFEHNQHQIEEARVFASSLGFQDFIVKKTTRFVDKRHEYITMSPVIDKQKIYFLRLPSDADLVNSGYSNFIAGVPDYRSIDINCVSRRSGIVYVGADGYVFPCGFLADRLYGYEAETHKDHARLHYLFELAGGAHLANLNYTSLEKIVNGKWFSVIEQSWHDDSRLDRCAHQCGKNIDLVTDVYSYMRGQGI